MVGACSSELLFSDSRSRMSDAIGMLAIEIQRTQRCCGHQRIWNGDPAHRFSLSRMECKKQSGEDRAPRISQQFPGKKHNQRRDQCMLGDAEQVPSPCRQSVDDGIESHPQKKNGPIETWGGAGELCPHEGCEVIP